MKANGAGDRGMHNLEEIHSKGQIMKRDTGRTTPDSQKLSMQVCEGRDLLFDGCEGMQIDIGPTQTTLTVEGSTSSIRNHENYIIRIVDGSFAQKQQDMGPIEAGKLTDLSQVVLGTQGSEGTKMSTEFPKVMSHRIELEAKKDEGAGKNPTEAAQKITNNTTELWDFARYRNKQINMSSA